MRIYKKSNLFKRLIKKVLLQIYQKGKSLDQLVTYNGFRSKYNIHDTFRFNGDNILFYGDGDICCKANSYIGAYSTIQAFDSCKVIIGRNCSISHNVRIYTQTYVADQDFSLPALKEKTGDIVIGDFVWIGANVFINPGISIGDNVVIGANSVVTSDIKSDAIYGGVPARLIREKGSSC